MGSMRLYLAQYRGICPKNITFIDVTNELSEKLRAR